MILGVTKETVINTKILVIFIAVVGTYEIQIFYTNFFLVTENVLRVNYQFLDSEIVDKIISNRIKYTFLGYFIIPIIILLRCLLFSAPVYTIGILQSGWKIEFKQLFKIALYGEVIFVMYGILKITILTIANDASAISNISMFSPLSLLSVSNYLNVKVQPFTYLFQLINLFEVAFWGVVVTSISNFTDKSLKQSFIHVLLSYGLSLLLWAVLVIFLQTLLL